MVQLLTVTCRSLVLSNKGKGMQSSSEQPLVGEERYVTTRITAAKETTSFTDGINSDSFCEIWSGTGSYAMLKVSAMCISWPFL